MIKGVPTLIHEEQIKASYPPTIDNKQANSSTHFLQSFLTKCRNGGTYSLVTLLLASDVECPRNHLEFTQDLLMIKKEHLLSRIANLKQWGVVANWGYAVPIIECSITPDLAHITSAHPPTSPVEVPLQMEELESTNYVPIMPVGSRNAQAHLVPISELTKDDNIVLSMSPAKAEDDPHHMIDSSPLYRTVHSVFGARQNNWIDWTREHGLDVCSACHGWH